jgi:molecular chaperone GrpE
LYATRDLIEEFITSLDNFDLALGTMEKAGPVEKGIYMIRTQIEDILRKRGLTKIEVKPGDAFDPATQEAIIETESEYPEGAIVEQIECGYRLHDKVIRPARVRISKGK